MIRLLAFSLLTGCWASKPITRFTPVVVREAPVKRFPSRIHTPDCREAMEDLAEFKEPEGECDNEEDYWFCAYSVRAASWYRVNRLIWQAVDECAPEAWKVVE